MLFVCAKYTATVYLFRTLYPVLIVKLVADFHNTCLVAQLRKSKYTFTQKIIVSTVFSGCAHLSHCVCVCAYIDGRRLFLTCCILDHRLLPRAKLRRVVFGTTTRADFRMDLGGISTTLCMQQRL